MNKVKVHLPKIAESITTATVVEWRRAVGDFVELDECLFEVTTDKVNSEIPSPVRGVLQEICAPAGSEVAVGELVAILVTDLAQETVVTPQVTVQETMTCAKANQKAHFLTPAVMRLAQEKGIAASELQQIVGSGEQGRITKKDLEAFTSQSQIQSSKPTGRHSKEPQAPPYPKGEFHRLPMSPLRKTIAENMTIAFYTAPHASLITEVDVTDLLVYIQEKKKQFFEIHGSKLTITAFAALALAKAAAKHPHVNSRVEENSLVVFSNINIGIAVSYNDAVMVPVIKDVATKDIPTIAREIQILGEKTQKGNLTPADTLEGTITLTNFGMGGIQIGMPILRYPEVAIIAIGAITRKACVTKEGGIVPRDILHLTFTFDHRAFDGMYACGFLRAVKEELENVSN